MKRCRGQVWIWMAVLVLLTGATAQARDYKVVVDDETIYFDLDRTRIAVGFAPSLSTTEQTALLASVPNLGSPAVKQVEEPFGMTVLNMKADASETELLAVLSALESSPEVDWAGPVLIYDRLDHVPTRKVYIGFDPTVPEAEIQSVLAEHGLTLLNRCDDWSPATVYVERSKSDGIATLDVCDALRADPAVLWAEPDWIRTLRYSTNDTYYNNQWYLNQGSDADIDAPEAWTITTGSSSIVISICDVGVQISHSDLNAKIETGYDAVDSDNDPTPATTYADDGHGTCCAGIAAAETNNSQGVAGVGYNCHLLGTRIGYIACDAYGCWIVTDNTKIVNCINYSRDHADVMSNSWGGGSSSTYVNNALSTAKSAGLTILFASGNDNSSVDWPAYQSTVIAVGATDQYDDRCDFPGYWGSNYGSSLDVVAPGDNQYVVDDSRTGAGYSSSSAYYSNFGGTSGACPVAAGVCALILSVNPGLTPDQVQDILEETADDQVGDPGEDVAGFDIYMGWGRVNAHQAVLSAGGITVTYPNGGETWYTGENKTITWTGSGFTGNVNIDLSRNGGGSYESLYSNTANDGSQSWTVSGDLTTQARIRVRSVSTPSIRDSSDANFTIASPYIVVNYPNGGETWYTGSSPTITWNSGGFTGNVNIDLSRYGGSSYESLYSNTANDGSQAWVVDGDITSQARIRVSSYSNPSIRDSSDANFTIANPTVTVLYPNGGESWNITGLYNIQWTSGGLTGNVKVELNRAYPVGSWEVLFGNLADDGEEFWSATGPSTSEARIRVSSVDQPTVNDVSNADFSIIGQPPQMHHDPLDDFAPGTGTITAIAYTPLFASVNTVKMFYREVGAGTFDSLELSPTVNPDEFAASLATIPIGSYEYYVKSVDNVGLAAYVPADAPTTLYTFDVDDLCATELAYDDGSAEYFSWSEGYDGIDFQWAVKFGPVLPPYVLCGARFAASRSLPDTIHSQVHVYVYEADLSGDPGTLVQDVFTGSIGNDIGGVPMGTNWAEVILKDDLGDPLIINSTEFFIAIGNHEVGKYEAFGRDDNGTLAHRSYVYDPCEETWFSEDDTGLSDNTYPGNRLVRARGYSLVSPPEVVIYRENDDIKLSWTNVGAPSYNVYSASAAAGPYTFFQSTTDTSLTVGTVGSVAEFQFYEVRASSE